MTKILSPEEQAAANRDKKLSAELLELCKAAAQGYTGDGAVKLKIDSKYAPLLVQVMSAMPGWHHYLAGQGELFLGTKSDIDNVLRMALPIDPPVAKPTPLPNKPIEIPISIGFPSKPIETPAAKPVPIPGLDKPIEIPVSIGFPSDQSKTVSAKTAPAIRFDVSKVEPRDVKLATVSGIDALNKMINKAPVYGERNPPTSFAEAHSLHGKTFAKPLGMHGLVETIHTAFDEHLGVELSPDHIWSTIMQGLAKLINFEPEKYRSKFVSHEGKAEVRIRRDDFVMGDANNDWASCLGQFSDALSKHIGAEKHGQLIANFSTTGTLERTVSEVALMDTLQSYFVYVVETRCGIPFISLRGAVADWENLAQKVRNLKQYGDLDWWLNDVVAIVDEFVSAAKGNVNLDFWRSIYKQQEQSGGVMITGWIAKLMPIVTNFQKEAQRNPMLGKRNCMPHEGMEYGEEADVDWGDGIWSAWLPGSLSTVPFIWEYLGTKYDYQFIAGIVGFSQEDGMLRPEMGWAVRPAPKA